MKTTVVIPNYNGKHFLQDCLDSLLQSTVEIAVIVVDNGSTDGSVSWIQEHFPQVKLICFSENKGFCTAVNTGIEAAATPYVFLLITTQKPIASVWNVWKGQWKRMRRFFQSGRRCFR